MRRFDFGYFLKEGFQSIFSHGLMSFAAVCMIVCCLLIMGSFSLVAVNLNNMLGDLERENIILAYVDESLSEGETAALKTTLEGIPNVESAAFMSRTEAMEIFRSDREDMADVLDGLPDDVLRDRYQIHIKDIELMAETSERVENTPGVGKIRAELGIAEGFVTIRNVAGAVAAILVLVLLLVSLFIISNTIRLATFTRREEIAIMKMCGATNGFVRWPFIFEGMILGIFGAVVAFLLQWGLYNLVAAAIDSSDTLQLITVLVFQPMAVRVLAVFAGTGLVIGAGGSVLAIRKFLQV